MNIKLRFLFVIIFCLVLPLPMSAATLYLDPVSKKVGTYDTFELKVRIGVMGGDECINAGEIGLSFDPDILEVIDFNFGESIFPLWVKRPNKNDIEKINQEGKIVFIGGVPGGYCGKIPGDPGESNILAGIIFTPKKPVLFHKTDIKFSSETKVLLNDGNGTQAEIKIQESTIEIDETLPKQEDEWGKKIGEDDIPPESFLIEITSASNVWDGQYFLIFFTTDKQTGIDHYEVLETKPENIIREATEKNVILEWVKDKIFKKKKVTFWKETTSPYLLKDQGLNSVIAVKAVDKAGNERIVEYENDALKKTRVSQEDYTFVAIFLGLIMLIILLVILKLTKKRKQKEDVPQNDLK